ncbi:hypothetical protein SDC9_188555 [bioreactor metagenome]|uniref:Uncharacterized protein n=1 Tax=bioreactor metagenome TaxID=1076179 RepID=A0A645HPM3_9ZZZZ
MHAGDFIDEGLFYRTQGLEIGPSLVGDTLQVVGTPVVPALNDALECFIDVGDFIFLWFLGTCFEQGFESVPRQCPAELAKDGEQGEADLYIGLLNLVGNLHIARTNHEGEGVVFQLCLARQRDSSL